MLPAAAGNPGMQSRRGFHVEDDDLVMFATMVVSYRITSRL